MNKGQLANAKRRALNILDGWNDVTGAVTKESGWYWELQSVIEDAVECGVQGALGVHEELESEKEDGAACDRHGDDTICKSCEPGEEE